jgi:cytochrome c oxidase assembly protein Cox11
MLGFSYAAVPFYQIFCQTTGFGGTIQRTQELSLQNLKPLDQAGPETTLFSNRTTSQFETNKETNSQMSFGQQNAAQLLTVHFNADTSPNLP